MAAAAAAAESSFTPAEGRNGGGGVLLKGIGKGADQKPTKHALLATLFRCAEMEILTSLGDFLQKPSAF